MSHAIERIPPPELTAVYGQSACHPSLNIYADWLSEQMPGDSSRKDEAEGWLVLSRAHAVSLLLQDADARVPSEYVSTAMRSYFVVQEGRDLAVYRSYRTECNVLNQTYHSRDYAKLLQVSPEVVCRLINETFATGVANRP